MYITHNTCMHAQYTEVAHVHTAAQTNIIHAQTQLNAPTTRAHNNMEDVHKYIMHAHVHKHKTNMHAQR